MSAVGQKMENVCVCVHVCMCVRACVPYMCAHIISLEIDNLLSLTLPFRGIEPRDLNSDALNRRATSRAHNFNPMRDRWDWLDHFHGHHLIRQWIYHDQYILFMKTSGGCWKRSGVGVKSMRRWIRRVWSGFGENNNNILRLGTRSWDELTL